MADQPAADLAEWVARTVGVPSVRLERLTSGNSRQMWLAGPTTPGAAAPWVVRVQVADDSLPYTLAREGRIYAALNDVAGPAPALRGARADGRALVMDRLSGDADIQQVAPAERTALVADLLGRLADVHRSPLNERLGDLFPDEGTDDLATSIAGELDRWEAIMRGAEAPPDPLLEFGLRWLRTSVPPATRAPVLVHGDAGPGNFLFADGRVTGLIDWELAHASEPTEDLAWITLRCALDDVPGVDALITDYCRTTGEPADPTRLAYYQALVLWRVMVIRHVAVGDLSRNLGRNIFYRLMHRRMFIDVMAGALGVAEPTVPVVPTEPTERSWLYDACVHHLKHTALPAIDDPAASGPTAGLIRVLRYLRLWDIAGPAGTGTGPDLATRIRTGSVDDVDGFAEVATAVLFEHELCRDIIGGGAGYRLARFRS
jgi:prepilin-type processing-associated H-X9-DG protein